MSDRTDEALNVAYELAVDHHEAGAMDDMTLEEVKLMRFPAEKAFSSNDVVKTLTRTSRIAF